jgi:hypothetical protein
MLKTDYDFIVKHNKGHRKIINLVELIQKFVVRNELKELLFVSTSAANVHQHNHFIGYRVCHRKVKAAIGIEITRGNPSKNLSHPKPR